MERKITKQKQTNKQTNKKQQKKQEGKISNTIALIVVALRPQRVSASVQQCSIDSWHCWTDADTLWGRSATTISAIVLEIFPPVFCCFFACLFVFVLLFPLNLLISDTVRTDTEATELGPAQSVNFIWGRA